MKELENQYQKILSDYLLNQTERNLYIGQNFVRQLIQKNIFPEDVINIHKKVMLGLYPDLPEAVEHSYDFLIEVMIPFGLTIKEHRSLLEYQEELITEMNVAAKIQNLILETTIPRMNEIDIGLVSIPVRKMNGDYVHFISDEDKYIGVAVTDVIGKGVPAALCMSMVKYGLDTLEYANNNPSYVLEVLNRIIEKSVDDSMFVSMFYGRFDVERNVFTYGSAGHEPATLYRSEEDEFYELDTKGLLLGIMPDFNFHQKEVTLNVGDIVIIITDGVTELREGTYIYPLDHIKKYIRNNKNKTAQQMCEEIYQQLLKAQHYDLQDDFTLVIMKRM